MRKLTAVLALITSTSFTCLFANFDSTIPVVDMQDFFNEDKQEEFLEHLSHAMHEYGFFAVTNSGIAPEIIQNAFQGVQDFFALDHDTKMKYNSRKSDGQRGYISFGWEFAKGSKFGDFKEYFHASKNFSEEQITRDRFYRNQWPEETDLEGPIISYIEAIETCMRPLERAFSKLLQENDQFISDMTSQGECLMRMIHYPAPKLQDPNDQAIWAAAHTDIDCYTILPPATADGLEVQLRDGTWIPVRAPDDCFIVNVGDFLQNMSNGYFRSSVHRVMSPAGKNDQERYSIVYFIHPRGADKMDPLPYMIEKTGRERKFADATRWELLMERLADNDQATDAMLQELGESGLMERLMEVGRASPDAMRRLRDKGYASPKVLEVLADLDKE